MPQGRDWFLFRAQKPLAIFGGIYVVVLLVLCLPFFQRHVLYLHALRYPLFANYQNPEFYGIAPGKTLPITIQSTSNISLGAWLTLAEPYYEDELRPTASVSNGSFDLVNTASWERPSPVLTDALKKYPTILMFHGNAGTRALPFRISLQRLYSMYLRSNVLMVDYRGFGDSTGTPSEEGLIDDALASWNWLLSNGARQEDISIFGSSLGTAVGSHLAHELSKLGQKPRALVLISPFTSIIKLLETYNLLGLFPLAKPLMSIPFAFNLLDKALNDRWDTMSIIQAIPSPVIIVHAKDDHHIPYGHSEALFDARSETLRSTSPKIVPIGTNEVVEPPCEHATHIDGLGTIKVSDGVSDAGDHRRTVLLLTDTGGHNRINAFESVAEVIRREISYSVNH